MFYYDIWVRSNRYHSKEPLTYASDKKLKVGSIVKVELQKQLVNGFISGTSTKPRFKTKSIDHVYDLPELNYNLIRLAKWLIAYYPSPIGNVTQQFIPLTLPLEKYNLETTKNHKIRRLPNLTKDQADALEIINEADTYLLHGKTGSGKTRIYIELAKQALSEGRSAIILTPEISLTSQLYNNFNGQFGENVILVHSKQTPKERRQSWLKCLISKSPIILLGPRSALFYPLNNIGLIIIDEAHEAAYKQEQMPHYHATRVASVLSQFNGAKLIIGSATPSVNDYFMAKNKKKKIIRLDKLAKNSLVKKSNVKIIDLKDKTKFSISNLLSDQLIDSIKQSLSDNEQSLLYLNRRGTSRLIFCDNCGWESLCTNCNLPLTYHSDYHQLRCHICGYSENKIPSICPLCDNDSIIYRTIGTKAVVNEVNKLFISARVARFDTDNLKIDTVSEKYNEVKQGNVDILIGTQLLAKGLDLPRLTTLGIIQADTSLYIPDYSSEERTFQLLAQVLGRVNRGHLPGRAVIQTYNPKSNLLKQAINEDYESFYENEIAERKQFKFPPYFNLLKLTCRRATSKSAEAAANKLKDQITELGLDIIIEGPSPAFHEKFQNKFQWQIVVKTTKRNLLTDIIGVLPPNWSYDIDPTNLL